MKIQLPVAVAVQRCNETLLILRTTFSAAKQSNCCALKRRMHRRRLHQLGECSHPGIQHHPGRSLRLSV